MILALLGCTATPLAWPVPRVSTDATEVVFADAVVHASNRSSIALHNDGTADVQLHARVDPPFYLAEDVLDLAAGSTRVLVVSWTPSDWAVAEAWLSVTGPLTDLRLPVAGTPDPDADGDGVPAEGAGGDDCDDADPSVYLGAPELCDGVDDDCDGAVDQDAVDVRDWYADADADGWGLEPAVWACSAPPDHASRPGDCDDADPDANPGETETWYDGVDADCSGGSDFDRDGDGHDNAGTGGDDCQDEDPAVNPGLSEITGNGVDDDCDPATPD